MFNKFNMAFKPNKILIYFFLLTKIVFTMSKIFEQIKIATVIINNA